MNARPSEGAESLSIGASLVACSNDALIFEYGTLVRRIAYQMVRRMPRNVEVDDLIQSGMIGLLEASCRYDELKGFSFASFAAPRIRGAMLDSFRVSDWSPRSLRRRQRAIERATAAIEMKTGATAKAPAIAQALGISIDTYFRAERDLFVATQLSLDKPTQEGSPSVDEPVDGQSGPSEQIEREQLLRTIDRAVERLSDSERSIFLLYYDEECLLREIGVKLDLSESRVCQILRKIVARLRGYVQAADRPGQRLQAQAIDETWRGIQYGDCDPGLGMKEPI